MAVAFNTFMREMGPILSDTLIELTKSPNTYFIYQEALGRGRPFSASDMMIATMIPEASVYRSIKKLRELGLIKEMFRTHLGGNGGPKAIVWELAQ